MISSSGTNETLDKGRFANECPIAEKRWEEVLKKMIEGQHKLVNFDEIPNGKKPVWFNQEKFNAGRQFVQSYYGGVIFSHFVSLIMMLFTPQGLKPLIFTERSQTPKKAYRRYISTTVHVSSWYRGGDIFQSESLAHQSLQKVRNYHSKTAEAVNNPINQPLLDRMTSSWCNQPLHESRPLCPVLSKDFNDALESKYLNLLHDNYKTLTPTFPNSIQFFNQFDMAITQFDFMGLALLHPEKFGLARATRQEFEGFVHLWRCLGWILGLDDQYNFCQFDSLPEARIWAEYFANNLIIPWLKSSLSEEYEQMGRMVVKGANHYFASSYETIYLFIAWVLDLSVPNLERYVSWYDYFAFKTLTLCFGFIGNLPFANYMLNGFIHLTVKLVVDPPRFWPRLLRPPILRGFDKLWNERS